mmetsp:Transcript_68378/g.198195  ORF Transcript_68378/g.198195 Transcript_68378/m.198195 type:complete len:225 (+) Transcript_68378:715-1389(+)
MPCLAVLGNTMLLMASPVVVFHGSTCPLWHASLYSGSSCPNVMPTQDSSRTVEAATAKFSKEGPTSRCTGFIANDTVVAARRRLESAVRSAEAPALPTPLPSRDNMRSFGCLSIAAASRVAPSSPMTFCDKTKTSRPGCLWSSSANLQAPLSVIPLQPKFRTLMAPLPSAKPRSNTTSPASPKSQLFRYTVESPPLRPANECCMEAAAFPEQGGSCPRTGAAAT